MSAGTPLKSNDAQARKNLVFFSDNSKSDLQKAVWIPREKIPCLCVIERGLRIM